MAKKSKLAVDADVETFRVIVTSDEETYQQGPYTKEVAIMVAEYVHDKGSTAVILDKDNKPVHYA